ncbi:expressed protein [Chlorella variabilis]|uniref:Expressed protein n=1 Tax=Chlorella variabilis TaxID=554065 RepID=E1ZAN6_CHLVA|nr:expressed protein [Chlorella variabilis]EFN57291.1 expressed protein [Chlorella variabilis]|eukprot:XP_005849393.1 expressed protein [Chlorella variabilis]
MRQAYSPSVPSFELTIQRGGVTTSLPVPFTFASAVRMTRLQEFLKRERWTVVTPGPAGAMAGGGGSHSDRSAQAEELLFLRDCLGPLRARPGAVPEKTASKMLEVGVKGLHERTQRLFGQTWGDFLLGGWPAAPAPAPPAPAALLAAPPRRSSPTTLAPLPPLLPLPPTASEAATDEEESLVELLLGACGGVAARPPCDPASYDDMYDDIDSIFTTAAAGFQLDMAAAVELEAATPAAAPPPAPAPAASTATTAATTGEPAYTSPAAFLEELDAELLDPAFLLSPGPAPSYLDTESLLALDFPDAPAFFPPLF